MFGTKYLRFENKAIRKTAQIILRIEKWLMIPKKIDEYNNYLNIKKNINRKRLIYT